MGNHKMWNIWKKADSIAKRMTIWNSTAPWTPYVGYFSGQVICVHFGVIRCTISKIVFVEKIYGTLRISHVSYITSISKAMLVSSGKRSSTASRPIGLVFSKLGHNSQTAYCRAKKTKIGRHGWKWYMYTYGYFWPWTCKCHLEVVRCIFLKKNMP